MDPEDGISISSPADVPPFTIPNNPTPHLPSLPISGSSINGSPPPPSVILNLQHRAGDFLHKLSPFFLSLGRLLNTVFPYLQRIHTQALLLWAALQPYHPEDLLPMVVGLILTFFGGHFFTLFAAIEAYRMCGYDETKKHLKELYENYLKVCDANEKDNTLDENNDGIYDVEQITSEELLTRKLSLILKAMDPGGVTKALSGLWIGFLGVLAVLRLKFAQAIALGATVGHIFEVSIGDPLLRPILSRAIPESHQKWIPVLIAYFCKIIGVSIAWFLQRVISAFYSSIRGASIFISALAAYLGKQGSGVSQTIASITSEGSPGHFLVTGVIAWTGFVWQVSSGFSLSFPLNFLLLPLSLLDWFIAWMAAVEQ